MGKEVHLEGQKFGRWTVLARDKNKGTKKYYKCQCECGGIGCVSTSALTKGHSKSCGCLKIEVLSKIKTSHGCCKNNNRTDEYKVWAGMLRRCKNKNEKAYNRYGGIGITVCERWEDFKNFLDDMGVRPTEKHSIDRIDNTKGYFPENCRWADPHEQANNKSNNKLVTVDGETKAVGEWAKIYGIDRAAIVARISRGISESESVKNPLSTLRKKRVVDFYGELLSFTEIAKKTGVSKKSIEYRLSKGFDIYDAVSLPTKQRFPKLMTAVKRTDVEVFNDAQFIGSAIKSDSTGCIAASP